MRREDRVEYINDVMNTLFADSHMMSSDAIFHLFEELRYLFAEALDHSVIIVAHTILDKTLRKSLPDVAIFEPLKLEELADKLAKNFDLASDYRKRLAALEEIWSELAHNHRPQPYNHITRRAVENDRTTEMQRAHEAQEAFKLCAETVAYFPTM